MITEEKYGFIYIWRDRKRKMYYIGSRWGSENDGYICSSKRMRNAYRKRPHDFRRRILETNLTKDDYLYREYIWLQNILPEELGKKYYNLTTQVYNVNEPGIFSKESKEKKKLSLKKFYVSDEGLLLRQKTSIRFSEIERTDVWKKKIGAAHLGKKKNYVIWNSGKTGLQKHTTESLKKLSNTLTDVHKKKRISQNLPLLDAELIYFKYKSGTSINKLAGEFKTYRNVIRKKLREIDMNYFEKVII